MLVKRLFLVMVVALSLSVMVAAQDDDSMDDTFIQPVECAEPGELTMWVWDENWQEVIGESIEIWKENYCPGAEVELIQQPWGNYWELLRTNAASGDMPDVLNMSQTFVNFYFENDALLNLQPYFDEFGVDTSLWGAGMIGPYTVDGDLYAAPVNWDTIAIYYNQDMFDAAGLDYPTEEWTWDDFADYAAALTNQEEDIFGAAVYAEFQAGYANFISSTGESPVLTSDRTECTLTSEESLSALNFLKGLLDEGYMPSVSEMGGASPDDAFALFASERVAMITAGSWKLPQATTELDFNWDIVRLPRNPETGISRSQLHSVGYMASSSTENPDLAANLILYLASDEAQQLFAEAGGVAPANPNPALQAVWAEAFADSGKNVQAYIDATQESQGVTLFSEVFSIANNELVVNIFDLDIPVEDAAQMACDAMAPFLGGEEG